ncbi:MAG: hypothetical protein AAF446_01875 [Pseudomonadota bacterium]
MSGSVLQKNNISSISSLLAQDPARITQMVIESGDWRADFSGTPVTRSDWQQWFEADQLKPLQTAVQDLFSGQIVNPSENQPALHMALRAADPALFSLDEAQSQSILQTRNQLLEWAGSLFRGETPIRTLLHVGIGGSDLGPRLVADALDAGQRAVRVEWLASLDGRRLQRLLKTLDPATTGMMVASKSFGTVETRLQAEAIFDWLKHNLGDQAGQHCWAATANEDRAIEFGIPADNIMAFPHWVGGRFSLWSSVGMSAAALVGPDQWQALLEGATEVDQTLRDQPQNSVALALARTLYALRGSFGFASLGVVSYEPGLRLLSEYLQQLIMESLGKGVKADGSELEEHTTPLIFGGAGTDLQHSLFQALHQGTDRHPMLLLGAARPQHEFEAFHREQLSHLLAQASALVSGVDSENPQKQAPGNNPVMLMLTPELSANSLGQLLATFEHAVYLLGCLWQINPFDQWGVEDGKRRAGEIRKVLENDRDASEPNRNVRFLREHSSKP